MPDWLYRLELVQLTWWHQHPRTWWLLAPIALIVLYAFGRRADP